MDSRSIAFSTAKTPMSISSFPAEQGRVEQIWMKEGLVEKGRIGARIASPGITGRLRESGDARGLRPFASPVAEDGEKPPSRLHDLLEKEAQRMAQSLHDEAGQLLAAVHLKLDEMTWNLPPEERAPVKELKSMLDDLEAELRRLSHELRPLVLDDHGLLAALQLLREGITQRTGLPINVTGTFSERLGSIVETALYRIVHEVLRIAQRSRAKKVDISFLKDEKRVECSMRLDDGDATGEDPGILMIRERVEDLSGTLSVRALENSTEFAVVIPLS
jgi:signal transduction histidine kinase